ncbi:hypothetical protein K456DRAFT_57543 [Colletotrichum gloeosporioides 23]|nr:hypothetical protein K456DRAFT_57543 [Colletotrichum gloeosporioides 23]
MLWFLGPILAVIGFGALGPIGGSFAAWFQSVFYGGFVPAGGLFALLQSFAMA